MFLKLLDINNNNVVISIGIIRINIRFEKGNNGEEKLKKRSSYSL